MPAYIDNEINNLREGLRLGYSAPRVTVEAVPAQVRSMISADSIFLGPAQRSDDTAFAESVEQIYNEQIAPCLLYTSPSPRDATLSRMPSSA